MAITESELARLEAGLDALETPAAAHRPAMRRMLSATWPPVVAVVVLIALWQVVAMLHIKPAELLPSPGDVARTLGTQWRGGHVSEVVWNSLRRAAVGYAAALALGTAVGLLLSRFRLFRRAIGPLLSSLQSLPSVAWVPLAILWFGLSDGAIYFVVIMGAFPSISNGLLAGIDQIPPLLLRVGDMMGARGIARYRHIVLPAALPGYLAGLKQAWSFSWRSLMAAELIAQSPELGLGLGQLLHNGQDLLDMSLVLVAIGLILAVGIAVELLAFGPLDRAVRRRRGLTTEA
jgi:NitT/TauT family transport system permease protein